MSNMKYATPLEYTDLQEYRETRDLPKEKRAEIEGIAKGLGLHTIYTDWTSPHIYVIDPRPAEYKSGFDRIDEFFKVCNERNLIRQERESDYETEMFGHRYRHCYQQIGKNPIKVDLSWNRKTEWRGQDPSACYCYGYSYWHFLKESRHATLTNESAARLLQERLDYLHRVNPSDHGKKTVKLVTGNYGFEGANAKPYERIAVYYGDGKRGSLDFDIAYGSAEIYLDEHRVVFSEVHGYDLELEGEFSVC